MSWGDGKVMTRTLLCVKVQDMSTDNPIRVFVLEEFRLRAADVDGAAARIVTESQHGVEPGIPLLTSVEDRRDVATLRALHAGESTESDAAQHAALDPLVSSWAVPKHYGPRIAESSQSPPSSFRLAVTESGINAGGAPRLPLPEGSVEDETTNRAIGLLWIGAPVGTHAGLLVLLGSYGDDPRTVGDDPSGWPLPLSRDLGVRVYENNGA
jgi:hypothetical protein